MRSIRRSIQLLGLDVVSRAVLRLSCLGRKLTETSDCKRYEDPRFGAHHLIQMNGGDDEEKKCEYDRCRHGRDIAVEFEVGPIVSHAKMRMSKSISKLEQSNCVGTDSNKRMKACAVCLTKEE